VDPCDQERGAKTQNEDEDQYEGEGREGYAWTIPTFLYFRIKDQGSTVTLRT
jgi:hypothetical protein